MIGILALQGDFEAHGKSLQRLGVPFREVRLARDLEGLDGLIIPGGESTTMAKLLKIFDLLQPLIDFGNSGKPVLGTCAGSILMCQRIEDWNLPLLGWIPATIERNAYGCQRESFFVQIDGGQWGGPNLPAYFIRAPRFLDTDPGVEVIFRHQGDISGVCYRNFTAITFHPELSDDSRFHQKWLEHAAIGTPA